MNTATLIRRSLRFHWRSHLGVVLGAAVGSAALIGALIVGDSVRHTLRERALIRLGNADIALSSGDRFFTRELGTRFGGGESEDSATLLSLVGTAANEDGTARANHVQVFGVQNYFAFARPMAEASDRSDAREITNLPADTVLLNEALASRLSVRAGDTVLLRMQKPSALSRDAVITPQSEHSVALRLRVHGVVSAEQGGDLDLQASQLPPLNAFLSLDQLAEAAGIPGRANLLLEHGTSVSNATERLAQLWTLPDGQITFLERTNRQVEISTPRIFLDPPIIAAAETMTNGIPVLTYLVNLLSAETNRTPYSMVTAAGPPYTPRDMRDDEIIINQWLANDLQIKPGDVIALTYFIADQVSTLTERTNEFRVRSIVPMEGLHADRTLMPEFPGLAKAESTHDWDAGFPLVHKIREKDEEYWKQHRGTPKAFVTLAAGQRMWSNRFGALTAIRWTMPDGLAATQFMSHIEQKLKTNLDPADLGFSFEPIRARALAAAEQSQDFGGLFIGFSFFLILAALILMGLLFAFGLQQRAAEIGTLLALGFRARQVRRLFLAEATALAALGGALGAWGGIYYAKAMLHGLNTVWSEATNSAALTYHASVATLATGFVAAVVVAVITIWLVLRKQARQPARVLLAGEGSEEGYVGLPGTKTRQHGGLRILLRRFLNAPLIAWTALVLTVGILGVALATGETGNAGYFFGAGSLALVAGLAFTSLSLGGGQGHETSSRKPVTVRVSLPRLLRNAAARRRTRSIATVALLACGVFLIVAIGAFRLDAEQDAWKRSAGTGGFALIAESTLPIVKDLNTADGRDALGLDEKTLVGVSFVAFRLRDGDDASCLNLNRAQQPRLLGVDPSLLVTRKAFSFAKIEQKSDAPWSVLKSESRDLDSYHGLPAIGDAASIQWALGKKIGDTLTYQDERGKDFKVRLAGGLANSILQGSLIIDEAAFTKMFPTLSGYRMFLIDCPSNRVPEVSAELTRALRDFGFEVTPAAERLAAFNAVQNTYLSTFQVLGGLGLLLGSFGLGIVVLRNVLERRGELALLVAVGFRHARVQKLVLGEHAALLCFGLLIGIVSALMAILPSLLSPRAELPVASLSFTLAGVLLFGLLSTWLATRAAVRGNLLEGLRNE